MFLHLFFFVAIALKSILINSPINVTSKLTIVLVISTVSVDANNSITIRRNQKLIYISRFYSFFLSFTNLFLEIVFHYDNTCKSKLI